MLAIYSDDKCTLLGNQQSLQKNILGGLILNSAAATSLLQHGQVPDKGLSTLRWPTGIKIPKAETKIKSVGSFYLKILCKEFPTKFPFGIF